MGGNLNFEEVGTLVSRCAVQGYVAGWTIDYKVCITGAWNVEAAFRYGIVCIGMMRLRCRM